MIINYQGKEAKLPDFFIVGAPKCGTTALYEYLRQHPDIFVPEGLKEIHFFGRDLHFKRPRITQKEYLSCFANAKNKKRVGEASVWYLYSKKAAGEIKEFCPSARIVIMLRNPVDMLYSLHSQLLYSGDEDIEDFKAALDAEEDRKNGLRIPAGNSLVESLFYRETVKYTDQVKRYLDVFGRERVHIILYDDFKNDARMVYMQTLRFLEVNENFIPNFKIINPNKRVKSKRLLNLLTNNPPLIINRLSKVLMPQSIRRSLRKTVTRYNTTYIDRKPMNPEVYGQLQAEFASEVEKLSRLLERDLTCWRTS